VRTPELYQLTIPIPQVEYGIIWKVSSRLTRENCLNSIPTDCWLPLCKKTWILSAGPNSCQCFSFIITFCTQVLCVASSERLNATMGIPFPPKPSRGPGRPRKNPRGPKPGFKTASKPVPERPCTPPSPGSDGGRGDPVTPETARFLQLKAASGFRSIDHRTPQELWKTVPNDMFLRSAKRDSQWRELERVPVVNIPKWFECQVRER